MIYLDTGVLVRALLLNHPLQADCARLIDDNAVSSCHTLAETFNTLTGFFKIPNSATSELIASLSPQMTFEVINQNDYESIIRESKQRGIQGGIIYDAIHAQIARRLRVKTIFTYNTVNFRHVAPDIQILNP